MVSDKAPPSSLKRALEDAQDSQLWHWFKLRGLWAVNRNEGASH